jgi:hypothetical protein
MATSAFIDMKEGDAPSTPNTGRWRVYFETGGLYYKEDDGTEVGPLGAAGAPVDATYIVQTADGTLSNEQVLSSLATGEMDVTTGTGVVSSRKFNLSASASPTVNDDSSAGYSVGSLWIDTTNSTVWRAVDVSVGAAVWHQVDVNEADEVFVDFIGTPTYDTVQDFISLAWSAGWVSGGGITDNGDGTIDVAAGTGFIRDANSNTSNLLFFDWPAATDVSLVNDSGNYVYVEYNAGTPQVATTTTPSVVLDNENTNFELAEIFRDGTTLHIANHKQVAGNVVRLLLQKQYSINKIERATAQGGLILSETGTRNVAVTAGTLWIKLDKSDYSAVDTSSGDTFDRYYLLNGTWTKQAAQTQWDNTQYNDVSTPGSETLVTLGNNRFSVQWFYVEPDGNLVSLYGQAEYVNLGDAENDPVPSDIPDRIEEHALLIGRIIFEKNDGTASAVESVFTTTFNAAGITDHGDLAGLSGDDHPQYLLAAGTRELTGDWDAGSYQITAEQFESDVATGTAPLIVASTTLVDNLNADLLDGNNGSAYALVAGDIYTGAHDFGGATSLEVPNSASPTVDAAGEIAVDTTVADYTGLMTYYDGTEQLYIVALPTANLSTTDGDVVAYNAANDEFEMVAQSGASGGTAFVNRLPNGDLGRFPFTTIDSTTTPANDDDTEIIPDIYLLSDGNDIVDVTEYTTSIPSGARRAVQLDVETANAKFGIVYHLDAINSIPLRGETVSLSFKARTPTGAVIENVRAVVLSWDGTADDVTTDVVSAWAVEGTNPTFAANWTAENTATNLNVGGTLDTWQTFSVENISVDTAGMNNLAVFIWVDDTDAAVGDILQVATIQLEIGSSATDYVPELHVLDYPQRATMWHDEATVTNGNAISEIQDTSQIYNVRCVQTPPADGDSFTHSFYIRAGTYTVYWLGRTSDNVGQIDWSLDGVNFETGQDWYSAATTYNVIKSASLTIAEDGYHVLRGTVNGKNASSSGYNINLTKYWIKPASD